MRTKPWKILAALVCALLLVAWYAIVHQDDEILALVRSDVRTDVAGERSWIGGFVNTHDTTLQDVAVTVEFLDAQERPVGDVHARAAELPFRGRLDLQAPLRSEAVRLRIQSVTWRRGRKTALMGPFRDSWAFGDLMVEPGQGAH